MATKKPAKVAPKTAAVQPRPEVILRKRDLIEAVAGDTGLRHRDVKAVTEGVLGVIGAALAEGKGLAVEPLGKLRVTRVADGPASQTLTVKLRQKRAGLAEVPEGS